MSDTINIEMPDNHDTGCDDDETHVSIDLLEIKKIIAGNRFVENRSVFISPREDIRYVSALALCCPATPVTCHPLKHGGAIVLGWLDQIKSGITGFIGKMIGGIKSNYKTARNVLSLISVIRLMN